MGKNNTPQNQFNNPAKSSPDVKKIALEKGPQRKAEKKEKRMKRNSIFFVTLHAIVSVLFLATLFALGILPFAYAMIVTAVVVILFAIVWITQRRKKAVRIIGRFFSSVIMLILLCASLGLGIANYILDSITGAPYEAKEQEFDLMNMNAMFSVTSDPFHIYLQDVQGDLGMEGMRGIQVLLSVNPETRQTLQIVTPGEYFTTIPGVSNGQKDRLKDAANYGVEASIAALSNLYETEIKYYFKIDTAWVEELTKLPEHGYSKGMLLQLLESIRDIDDHMQTNLTKYEVQELFKMLMQNGKEWTAKMVVADGTVTSSTTFTAPTEEQYVIVPDTESVKRIVDSINRLEDGEILKENP